ncbi:3,4-dihydroxy-2-butanone 4-phosphate synthase, RibB [Cynara cardunculus var. scolymus]|uniref:GTP cyclohydrolase II n=1 Tax=Cynara cardunculus var. scolymus TaxID=59895 RepID=A0A124SCC8_CYNCS|nr:3,4-dihydroxy-2-butanone 4-phosphate synthase, RibB [Cynara cardunculus var. scolymus]
MASINMSSPSTSLLPSKMITNFSSYNGLRFVNLSSFNGQTTEAFLQLRCSKSKGDGKLRASLLPIDGVDGGFPVNHTSTNGVEKNGVSMSSGIVIQPDSIALGTLSAETTPSMNGFVTGADEYDLDQPTSGFSSIPEAIEDIRQGKMVVVVDDEDRENEGDLIMAASCVTPEAMAFIVKHGTGIVCVSMKGEDLDRLELPLMIMRRSSLQHSQYQWYALFLLYLTFSLEIDKKATTIKALASKDSTPGDFNRPGHIFPLKYREGGVLKRAGHTEASVDLAMLAGFDPVAVLCEIVDDDGSMARLPKLREFVQRENLKIISIADLIRYRRKTDKLVERASAARIPTTWGPFVAYCYRSILDGIEHIAMVKGDIGDGKDTLVRLRAYNLQDDGRDTVEANEELGLPVDSREYGIGAQILRDLGVRTMKLMTNNPAKYSGLKGYGLEVAGRVPLLTPITKHNKRYLETKRAKMGHVYGNNNGLPNLITQNEKSTTQNPSV